MTLAHELGHSFHDRQVYPHSILNRSYSMPVAETASTFNEVMVMKYAVKMAADKNEKLTLLESELRDTTQIITDILSRFIFESEVFERRVGEFLDSDALRDIMIRAQKETYGDALDENFMHPYMWVCKGHYYSGSLSFYNYPYAFGGLFARGLYAKYEKEGDAFPPLYKKLLWATGITDAEDTARLAGIDLTSAEFWRSGLESIKGEVEEFCSLVEEMKAD
jgi:oligoendopeptidase F